MRKVPLFVVRKILAILFVMILLIISLGPKILGGMIIGVILLIVLFGPKFFLGMMLNFFLITFLFSIVYSDSWYGRWRGDD